MRRPQHDRPTGSRKREREARRAYLRRSRDIVEYLAAAAREGYAVSHDVDPADDVKRINDMIDELYVAGSTARRKDPEIRRLRAAAGDASAPRPATGRRQGKRARVITRTGHNIVLVRGWKTGEVLRGAGWRPIYSGTGGGWTLDLHRLPDAVAALEHAGYDVTMEHDQ